VFMHILNTSSDVDTDELTGGVDKVVVVIDKLAPAAAVAGASGSVDAAVSAAQLEASATAEHAQAPAQPTDAGSLSPSTLVNKAASMRALMVTEKNKKRISTLLQRWQESPEQQALMRSVEKPRAGSVDLVDSKGKAALSAQFRYLFSRAGKNAIRNKLIIKAKLAQTIFMALIIGLIYLNVSDRSLDAQVQDRAGSLFFLCVNMVMGSSIGVLSVFALEKAVFMREYKNGYYSLPSYFFSKTLVELPHNVIFPFILACIVYWMVGYQNEGDKFIICAVALILLTNCGTAIGVFAACAFDSLQVALAVVPMFLLPLMIFSGFFVNSDYIPVSVVVRMWRAVGWNTV